MSQSIGPHATSAAEVATAFPFSSVVGQESAKLALLLAAVDPSIGGVLLRGQKGSAKTTLARGLAPVLGSDIPFVNLPLGASEDRVVGTLDISAALTKNDIKVSPGLLAEANGGILYVDEVNLLADHIVDTLLDVAVCGVNRVERDGLSHVHPARFVLVGSMNPEEGELRPQLLDRFGLCVDVKANQDVNERVEAIARRLAFDGRPVENHNPSEGYASYSETAGDRALRQRVLEASSATISTNILTLCSEIAVSFDVEGLRTDLVLAKAASAHAGLVGNASTTVDDVKQIAPLVLVHRGRKDIFDSAIRPAEQTEEILNQVISDHSNSSEEDQESSGADDGASNDLSSQDSESGETTFSQETHVDANQGTGLGRAEQSDNKEVTNQEAADQGDTTQDGTTQDDGGGKDGACDGQANIDSADQTSNQVEGKYRLGPSLNQRNTTSPEPSSTFNIDDTKPFPLIGTNVSIPPLPPAVNKDKPMQTTTKPSRSGGRMIRDHQFDPTTTNPIAVAPTVRNLAKRRQVTPTAELISLDLREAVRETARRQLLIFVVDTSGSMGADNRSTSAGGAIRELLVNAYQDRHQVALVTLQGDEAQLVLSPTSSVEVANLRLSSIKTGGATPLAAGIDRALKVTNDRRYADSDCTIVLLTDGRATGENNAFDKALSAARSVRSANVNSVVLGCENSVPLLGLAQKLAEEMAATFVQLDVVSSTSISSALTQTLNLKSGVLS